MVRMLTSVVALMVALGLLAGCGGGQPQQGQQEAAEQRERNPQPQQEQQQAANKPVSGAFVGEASGAGAFVAIVAEKPKQGGATRELSAYVCDGKRISWWLTEGSAQGNTLNLTSEDGARLEGKLTPEGATGTLTSAEGESFSFEAAPAEGIDGYYPVTVSPKGHLSGTAWGGSRVEGRVSGQGEISATFTPPEGEGVDFEASAPNLKQGENRWIVLADEQQVRIKGSKKGKPVGFIDPTNDF